MPEVLRFGISSLDELLGAPPEKPGSELPLGIFLPGPADEAPDKKPDGSQNEKDQNVFTTSVCLIGPTGTGKSIFALHMASTYLSDCKTEKSFKKDIELPTILYISTDLTYKMAHRAWNNFALNYPLNRRDPFSPKPSVIEDPIELVKCHPTGLAENFKLVREKNGHVLFLDMAAYTAGDDWGFLHKLLSLLSMPNDTTQSPRHLVVIDAIEGFEALAGDINAFGEKSTRRSRIAQVMRLIAGKCHLLTVVEQSKGIHSEETLGEEFVADTVIRLDSISTRNYERRMLKVEKCRGQSHIRGQHHYSIRSGIGSTTGEQTNPDDPMVPALDLATITKKPDAAPNPQNSQAAIKPTGVEARSKKNDDTNSTDEKSDPASTSKKKEDATQSYVQVFHSVHRISRKIMEDQPDKSEIRPPKPDPKAPPPPARYAAFGIEHLDNMLGGKTEVTLSKTYNDFQYDTRGLPCSTTTALIGDSLTQKTILGRAFLSRCFFKFHERMFEMCEMLDRAPLDKEAVHKIWGYITRKVDLISTSASQATKQNESYLKDLLCRKSVAELIGELEKSVGKNSIFPLTGDEKIPLLITNLARWLLGYPGGVAVMLVTHNTDSDLLAAEFTRWLHSEDELTRLNQRMEGYRDTLRTYIKGGTICRRLEIHSLSSEVLVHIVKQAVHAAQRKIITHQEMEKRRVRYPMSWPVRLVIDDFSSLRSIFPELREDPLLFPSILFHLEREGVTTLIVDTQSGKPETTIVERFETELRQMVHHRLYTWRVPFYGESRVAITAIPPLSHEYAGIVREVRWETGHMDGVQGEPATVDPHFELYSGLEEGNPQPVPLHARFYAETPAMQEYIEIENHFLGELFNCHSRLAEKNPPRIIFGMLSPGYSDLRSLAYLQRDTRLDYTFIFQVDEFWAMRPPGRHKRAGAFQPQWSYLDAITATSRKTNLIGSGSTRPEPRKPEDYKPNVHADPYELFMLRKQDATPKKRRPGKESEESDVLRRRHFYEHYYQDFEGYEIFEDGSKEQYHLDRVPFSWDFGFLLCQEKAWKDNVRPFVVERPDGTKEELKVRQVWRSLIKAEYDETAQPTRAKKQSAAKNEPPIKYVSWRIFAEACKKAAEEQSEKLAKPASAFDFAQISPESFSSLMLEVWLSDIYDSLTRDIAKASDAKTKSDLEAERMRLLTVTKRQLFIPIAEPLKKPELKKAQGVTPSSESQKKPERITLLYLVQKYWLELYKSWLLLIELINLNDIIGEAPVSTFELKSKNTDFCAISSRHWYKTATQCPDDIATQEPLVAVRLPGHFSVRGDWFLAVSGGSRSIRQAERALDLLNSRRANITRLQMGVGLPTRIPKLSEPGDKPGPRTLFTKLISHQHGQHSVEYDTLLKIAADSNSEFYWAWRSSLEDYAESNRIWHRWLNCALLWWHRKLLRYRSAWRNSFEIHDALNMKRYEPDEFTDRKGLRAKEQELDEIKSPEKKQKALDDYLKKFPKAYSLAQLNLRREYLDLWNLLIEELQRVPIVQTETPEDR